MFQGRDEVTTWTPEARVLSEDESEKESLTDVLTLVPLEFNYSNGI